MHDLLTVLKENWQLIAISGGPLTASLLVRLLIGKNRMVFMLVNGSAAWLAVRVILSPHLDLAKKNVGYLVQITGH
jgi:hypothetical protein